MKTSNFVESRRNFLKTVIPAGGMICFGCPNLLKANTTSPMNQDQQFLERIQAELKITHEELFNYRFKYFIERMEKFADYIGRDKVISMLKDATDDCNSERIPNLEATSLKDFINPILKSENNKIRLDIQVLELTDKVYQHKVTNCLWAKTFLAKNAGDIGYATICHGDISGATAYNPKIKLELTKTLMEGHDYCNHRYSWEG
jgi:hypothetical protein